MGLKEHMTRGNISQFEFRAGRLMGFYNHWGLGCTVLGKLIGTRIQFPHQSIKHLLTGGPTVQDDGWCGKIPETTKNQNQFFMSWCCDNYTSTLFAQYCSFLVVNKRPLRSETFFDPESRIVNFAIRNPIQVIGNTTHIAPKNERSKSQPEFLGWGSYIWGFFPDADHFSLSLKNIKHQVYRNIGTIISKPSTDPSSLSPTVLKLIHLTWLTIDIHQAYQKDGDGEAKSDQPPILDGFSTHPKSWDVYHLSTGAWDFGISQAFRNPVGPTGSCSINPTKNHYP